MVELAASMFVSGVVCYGTWFVGSIILFAWEDARDRREYRRALNRERWRHSPLCRWWQHQTAPLRRWFDRVAASDLVWRTCLVVWSLAMIVSFAIGMYRHY
jgi:hypothetical protein